MTLTKQPATRDAQVGGNRVYESGRVYERRNGELIAVSLTDTEYLHAFYVLANALKHIAATSCHHGITAKDRQHFADCDALLTPRMRELAKPFREAGIFKSL